MPAQTITVIEPAFKQPVMWTKVYYRATWAGSWIYDPHMHCEGFTEEESPGMGQATITRRHGTWFNPTTRMQEAVPPLSINGEYVKVEVLLGVAVQREWAGVVAYQATQDEATDGRSRWQCYDMRYFLSRHRITTSEFLTDNAGQVINDVEFGLTFNEGGEPNRSADLVALGGEPSTYLFARKVDSPEFWSTREMVRYLVRRHAPDGSSAIWSVLDAEIDKLPSWDKPVVKQNGRTLAEILDQQIERYRLYGWRVAYNDFANTADIKIDTYTNVAVVLPNLGLSIPANADTIDLKVFESSSTAFHYADDAMHQVDQVIVEGEPLTWVLTLTYDEFFTTLSPKWTVANETDMEDGGWTSPGYPAATEITKQRLFTAAYRSSDKFRDVFRYFQMPDDFDAGDGYISFGKTVLPTTRLIVGVDYSTGSPVVAAGQVVERPIFAIVKIPNFEDRYVYMEEIRQAGFSEDEDPEAPMKWSAMTRPIKEDSSFEIRTSGMPQWVLGAEGSGDFGFDPLAGVDDIINLGKWSWKEMHVTVAYQEDRRLRGVYPVSAPAVDQVRRMSLDAEGYEKVVMLANTVIDVSTEDGDLVRSPASPLTLADDTDKLNDLAFLAYQYYGQTRVSCEVSMPLTTETLLLGAGQFIEDIDATGVNSLITKLSFSFPIVDSPTPEPVTDNARVALATSFAQLDVLKL